MLIASGHSINGQTIPNPSFELGSVFSTTPGYVSTNSAIQGWTSSPAASTGLNPAGGLNSMANNGVVPNGARVAFLQSTGNTTATLSTTITGLTAGKTYIIHFGANARAGTSAPTPSYRINGGPAVRFVAPAVNNASVFTSAYRNIGTIFTATGTTASLEISNTTSADSTLLLDNFTIAAATPIVVTSAADTGTGSLRAAITSASTLPSLNIITFAPALNGATITLSSELAINDASGLAIDASSLPAGITIHGGSGNNRIFSTTATSVVQLRQLTLTSGNLTGGAANGGALRNLGSMGLSGCTLTGNSAASNGGAIENSGGTLTISHCTLTGNSITGGGQDGGAINNSSGGALTIVHCTISGNTAKNGGGITNNGSNLSIANSILFGNTATTTSASRDVYNFGGILTRAGANIIEASLNSSGGTDSGAAALTTDPLLSSLASNGGPTQTMGIALTSPARNASVDSNMAADQRGRAAAGTPDLGAFELQSATFTLDAASYRVMEGDSFVVTVRRGADLIGTATVRVITSAGTATTADFTPRLDSIASELSFAEGETTKTVTLSTTADTLVEGNHLFTVALGSAAPVGPAQIGIPGSASVVIVDPLQVTNANDSGVGSLRQVLADAAAVSGPDAIHFSAALNGQTITLGSEIAITDTSGITVTAGALSAGITINGGPATNRLFYVDNTAIATLTNLTLTGGNGTGAGTNNRGGAIYNDGSLTLRRCTLHGNTAQQQGGAIYSSGANASQLTLIQCTLGNNQVTAGPGGAISNDGAQGTLSLSHCTISGNTASTSGGGVALINGPCTLDNSIIAGNTATSGSDVNNSGATLTRSGQSIIPVLNTTGGGSTTGGGTLLTSNPLLAPLASNGGAGQTFALLPTSPALNAAVASSITTDQRGLPVVGVPDIGAFEVQTGGVFGFSLKGYSGLETAGTATVTVLRNGGFAGTASVTISSAFGTATAADFSALSQTLNFADGEASKNVSITLANDGPGEPNESFTVTLSAPGSGTSIGSNNVATVTIVDGYVGVLNGDDIIPSAPVILFPAINASVGVPTGGSLVISGTATDDRGVASVRILDANNAFLSNAILESPGARTTKWSLAITPATGMNTFKAVSTDYQTPTANSSVVVTRSFKVLRPLAMGIAGDGMVTAGFAPASDREPGRLYTISATPKVGSLFAGWTILSGHTTAQLGILSTALEQPSLSFIFREGLALQATFVPNPFLTSVVGAFYGGIVPSTTLPDRAPAGAGAEDGTTSSLSTEGAATFMVQTTGSFSGSLTIDGQVLPVAGVFDPTGVARFGTYRARNLSVPRTGKPSLTVTVALDVTPPLTGKITGTVAEFDGSSLIALSNLDADRAPYSTTTPLPEAPYLNPGAATALYTTIFAPTGPGLGAPTVFPQGYGYAQVTLSRTGSVTVSGVLSDGTPFTQSTFLSANASWRLFVQLYNKLGYIAGSVTYNATAQSDFSALSTRWLRPLQDTQHYSGGWSAGYTVNTYGAKLTAVTGTSVVNNLPTSDANGNADLKFTSGLLSSAVTKTVSINSADTILNMPADTTFTLKINRTTGLFDGVFLHSDSTRPAFKGIIYQKGLVTDPSGYGHFLTTTPAVKDYTGQGGSVLLDPQ